MEPTEGISELVSIPERATAASCFGAAVGFLLVDELRRMAERALARRRGEVATT